MYIERSAFWRASGFQFNLPTFKVNRLMLYSNNGKTDTEPTILNG